MVQGFRLIRAAKKSEQQRTFAKMAKTPNCGKKHEIKRNLRIKILPIANFFRIFNLMGADSFMFEECTRSEGDY